MKTSKNQPQAFGFIKTFLLVVTAFLTTFFFTKNTHALPEALRDFFDTNNIFYHDPTSSAIDCEILQGSYDGIPSAGLSILQSEFVDRNYPIALKLSKEYKIPWEAVVAQGVLESASGTSRFARERNNFFGIGAFDSNPNNAHYFKSHSDGWRGYYENIRKTSVYRANGAFNFPNDPYGYLKAIKKAGYATDPNYVKKTSSLIKAIENRGLQKNWELSRNLPTPNNPNQNPDSTPNSTQNLLVSELCANSIQNDKNITTADILASNDFSPAALKNINNTAIYLAHPGDYGYAKDTYKKALFQTGVYRLGDACSMRGESCDAFVATVLRYSNIDPDVPCCGAYRMMKYFLSRKDKYIEIPNLGNTSNLQPGDIRSKPSHVELVVKLPNESRFRIASASHCDRYSDYRRYFFPCPTCHIFRRR